MVRALERQENHHNSVSQLVKNQHFWVPKKTAYEMVSCRRHSALRHPNHTKCGVFLATVHCMSLELEKHAVNPGGKADAPQGLHAT